MKKSISTKIKNKIFKKTDIEYIRKSSFFDAAWYLEQNLDVQQSKMDAAKHYLKFGWKELRDPSALFSSLEYLSLNPDVKESNMCPLLHYEKFGKKERRQYKIVPVEDENITQYWEQRNKLKKHEKVHYTCMVGGYDKIRAFSYIDPEWDYVLFTDNQELIKKKTFLHWHIRPLQFDKLDNVRNARWHKIHPHLLFSEYKYSFWEDSNHNIKNGYFYQLADEQIQSCQTLAVSIHPERDCIYDEANICIKWGRDNEDIIQKQISELKKNNFPEHYGLFETFLIFREHNNQQLIQVMNDWWYWIENYSRRDQLSFTYALWKNNYKCYNLAEKPIRKYLDTIEIYRHTYTPSTDYQSGTKQSNVAYRYNYKNYNDLKLDILANIQRINFPIDLIVGIPRSGIIPAYMLGAFLHKPVKTLDEFIHNIQTTKSDRMKNINSDFKNVLILDDSVNLGASLRRVKEKTKSLENKYCIKYAAIYATEESKALVDFHFMICPQPRIFEWNYLKSGHCRNWAFDIDGVLCADPTDDENDDGANYKQFILNAKPLYLPSCKVGALVTSRLEKYRTETETWMKNNHVEYDKLYMLDLPSKEERIKQKAHTKTKIEVYKNSPSLSLFIESNRSQAELIAKATGKPVICVETGEYFYFP